MNRGSLQRACIFIDRCLDRVESATGHAIRGRTDSCFEVGSIRRTRLSDAPKNKFGIVGNGALTAPHDRGGSEARFRCLSTTPATPAGAICRRARDEGARARPCPIGRIKKDSPNGRERLDVGERGGSRRKMRASAASPSATTCRMRRAAFAASSLSSANARRARGASSPSAPVPANSRGTGIADRVPIRRA